MLPELLRSLKLLHFRRIILAFCVAVISLTFQSDYRAIGQGLPVVSLVSIEPSSEVLEGNSLRVTLEIDPPVSAGDPGLTGGRLIGGIRVWDSWKSDNVDALIAFAFFPGDSTDTLRYYVDVADDGGAVTTGRRIRIDVNPLFEEYQVGAPSEATVRVLDGDGEPPVPPPTPTPTPTPTATPTPTPTPTATPTPTPTPTATPTPTPTPTATPTPTPTLTATPTPTLTPTPKPQPTSTPRPKPTRTPIPTPIPEPTPTPTPTLTPTPKPQPTSTPRPKPTRTPIPEPTPTPTPTPEPTETSTPRPTSTPTPTPATTPTPTLTPTPTQMPTPGPTLVPIPTSTPTPTAALTPTPTAVLNALGGVEPSLKPTQRELERPAVPVIGDAIPRIRNTLGDIASSPRRRATLIIIQALASIFAASVFTYLILRRQ